MERTKQGKRRFMLSLSLILLLVTTGLVMIYRVFDQYEDVVLQNEDRQLYGLARSVDRSVESYLGRFSENLRYVTNRREFWTAEQAWLDTGNAADLLERMRGNLLSQDRLCVSMLALRGDETLLSTSDGTDYVFPPGAGREGEISIRPCLDETGTIYLSFARKLDSGVTYAAVVDLEGFYQRVAGDLTAGTQDHIMLLDAGGQTLIHRVENEVRVEAVRALGQGGCDLQGLDFLMHCQEEGREGSTFYETTSCRSGERYTARMAVVPALAEDGFFAVGVSVNYNSVIRPLHLAAIRLLAYGGMVVTGILLLVALALWTRRKNEDHQRELEILREKNRAMEELNRQTRELAHHQRLETIGTFTSSIAHEFNNLLSPIMGYSILTLEKLPGEETELYDNVLEIYNASCKAKDIISRLSDISRKNTPLTFQYVSPDELVRRVLEVAAPVRPARVAVTTELNCRYIWLHGNETQLSQLMLNLVLNAFQAMGPEGGELRMETWVEAGCIHIRVADNGCGIPKESLPHIFEPFYTTKETGKGTGLGLAIVQQVVEEHKGSIDVETEEGRGTTVTVTFSVTEKEEAE